MKKSKRIKPIPAVLALLMAATMLLTVLGTPQVQAAGYQAAYIENIDDKVTVNYQDYLDSSVMYRLPDTVSSEQEISVIIDLGTADLMSAYEQTDKTMSLAQFVASDAAEAIRQQNRARKAQILESLDEKGICYSLGEDYEVLLSGFEVRIQGGDFAATCQSLGRGEEAIIGEEYHVAQTQLVENTVNVYATGIFNSSDAGYDGSGMVVAVLDTGLDSSHTAFSTENFTSDNLGLTYADVAAVIGQSTAATLVEGLTVDDVYINEKVPFGFDYADSDPDAYSTHNNHGTHVAGVIVGRDDVITGVAPNAQVVAMKIFSDVMDTARATWILSALEDCVVLGVDVINMSIGTACGFSREGDEEKLNGVYDRIREAGISMVVAASNSYSSAYGSEKNGNLALTSNPDTGTVGSPSTYDGVLSVASINGVETPYILYNDTIIYFTEATDSAAEEKAFFDDLLGDADSMELEYVLVPGVGRSADYTGLDMTGKIALVRRGSNTFEEKAMIAEAQGAVGIIVYNNVSGDIKMNVGKAALAVCSISQDDGEMLAAQGSGKLTIKREQTSGPFISDFSSWGPTPSLTIKPEITAHGGNILSSITGGGYDRISGTSMACPNLAGVVVLLRQYVTENFPDIADDKVAVNAMVNRLLMSTADIAMNTNGLPYSVRKQGAGLANLLNSINTTAYIKTYDADGKVMDKTKLELMDDPERTGEYEMHFTVENFGDKAQSYELGWYVMTEGVSDTKTAAGETTVTEEAFILEGARMTVSVNGTEISGKKITAEPGSTDITVKLTLTEENKTYLNESFANGMYVEGYITLDSAKGVDLSVPYLAFYGDWTVAPLFDLDYFQTNADELDDSIELKDKTLADAYSTRPVGGVQDDYVSYLGSYYFLQDPADLTIPAAKEHISLSNQEGTIHALRFIWAGMLRNAAKIDITITDDTTGEVIFETEDLDVRKSYSDGGASIYPANVEVEFDTTEYNLMNNTTYTVRMEGQLDYGDGGVETNENNVFEFPLTMDFEAPTVTDVQFTYEYDKTMDKNRLYAKVGIYDNHYTMSAQLGYVVNGFDENDNPIPEMLAFEQYMTPVYSQEDSVTWVTYELTDYVYKMKENAMNKGSFTITCYDYALNYATFEIGLPDEYLDFYYDGLEEGITLSPNEVFSLEPLVYPETQWAELLDFASSKPSVVRVVNNKLVAAAPGKATVKVRDPSSGKDLTFPVTVLSENDEGYRRYDKPVADIFRLDGYETVKAYFMINSEDKELGDDGNIRFFEGNFNLSMYPSETVRLNHTLDAYFPNDTQVVYESSNENIVTIDANGYVTAVAEGYASVTLKVMLDGRSTYYSESVTVEVKDPYVTTGAMLSHYYGNGGTVIIPEDLNLREIGSFAFSNFDYVMKTPEELAFDDAETSKQWYIGDATISKVVIPEGVEKINAYAFANLTALEEIELPSTLEFIEYGAFYGCSSLQKISFSGENNLKVVNQSAFENCDLKGKLELSSICMISPYAFAGNQKLEAVITGDSLLSVGSYAFAGCKKLDTVTITAPKVKYGSYAFTGCESLKSFYVNGAVLPEGMFYECHGMESVTVGPDVNDIGQFAFRDTEIASFTVESGNTAFKAQTADHILSADGAALVAVSPTIRGSYSNSAVTQVAKGAFSHTTRITEANLPNVTVIGDYGFGSSEGLTEVTLGKLEKIGEYAFFETGITKVPAFTAETEIGRYAFAYTDITEVTVPDNMVVAEGVFSENMKLETVTVGDNVTLGKHAFQVSKDNAFTTDYYDEGNGRRYYYIFGTALKNVTIGENAVIGENAFYNAASLESVTLGAGADIGRMAFYNNCALKEMDLSQALRIGDYAFSGDVYYACLDDAMTVAAVSTDGYYIYTYHGPMLETLDLSSAQSVGEYAFAYCRELKNAKLGDGITELPQYAFAGCIALEDMQLNNVTKVGDYCFMQSGLASIDLSKVESVGKYSFVESPNLASVTLNPNGTDLDEGVFTYCKALAKAENMGASRNIGSYAFANTALTRADLTSAETLGDLVFMKEELTPFTVHLGTVLTEVGDNPFALCDVAPFITTQVTGFNGVDYEEILDTFAVSDTVQVIDGSLYCQVPGGLELITYAGTDYADAQVAEGTVRITYMAFAGSDVQMVTLPYTTTSIGHKAFYGCDKLHTVVFGSYDAPILEEEFDVTYYESLLHVPGTGSYGTYTDYDGTEVEIIGTGMIPYYMWNASGGLYSNAFYGANFVDYVGYVDNKLTMVRPVNGIHYDSYVYSQYFDLAIDGAAGADDVTLAAIAAIKAIPEKVSYEDRHLVEEARAAYDKIATTLQQALVTNYADLIGAEQRITALTPTEEAPQEETPTEEAPSNVGGLVAVGAGVVAAGAAVVAALKARKKGKEEPAEESAEAQTQEEENSEEA